MANAIPQGEAGRRGSAMGEGRSAGSDTATPPDTRSSGARGRSTRSNGARRNVTTRPPLPRSAARTSSSVSCASFRRSVVAGDAGGGTRTTTSRIRSGGIEARITLAARVARNPSVGPGPFTVNTRAVPGAVALARAAAVVARWTSSSDRNGLCRSQAIHEPATIASASAAVATSASGRCPPSARQRRTRPSAARIGTTYPNVTNRSAGKRPVASEKATPPTRTSPHERRNRPTKSRAA